MSGGPQLSYSHGTSACALLGETIGENLRRIATTFGDSDAVVDVPSGRRWTYRQLDADVDAVAIGLLISAESFKTSDYRAMIGAVRGELDELEELERVIFLGTAEWDALLAAGGAAAGSAAAGSAGAGSAGAGSADLDRGAVGRGTGAAPADLLAARSAKLSFDDAINIQYTSGTTGFPKGATLSHHNILNNGFFIGEMCRYTEQDRVCIPVPFYHCFGMVLGNLACTTHGACIVIPAPGFEPAATLRAVQQERCTSLYGVPTMFIAELALPDFASYDLSALRTGIMAGSPCPVEVMKRVVSEMHMSEVTIAYGMTETSPVSAQTRADDDMDRRVSTVGRVHPHVEVKVIDPETGQVVPRGTPGELCTRGYSVMLGYWDDDEQTRGAIDAARWMHTGDLAVMDDAGYLNIAGRIKDMVIRGGENIYPREVEEFLYAHPAIEDVQVIGGLDAKYGEELCAWVRLHPGETLTLEELREFCTGKIAHYKIPRYLRISGDFPMTVTGKVQKYKMREVTVAELGLGDAAGIET